MVTAHLSSPRLQDERSAAVLPALMFVCSLKQSVQLHDWIIRGLSIV